MSADCNVLCSWNYWVGLLTPLLINPLLTTAHGQWLLFCNTCLTFRKSSKNKDLQWGKTVEKPTTPTHCVLLSWYALMVCYCLQPGNKLNRIITWLEQKNINRFVFSGQVCPQLPHRSLCVFVKLHCTWWQVYWGPDNRQFVISLLETSVICQIPKSVVVSYWSCIVWCLFFLQLLVDCLMSHLGTSLHLFSHMTWIHFCNDSACSR